MSIRKTCVITGALIGATVFFGLSLVSSRVSADDTVVDDVILTVRMACTISGTGMNTHNATINPGTHQSDIGVTTLKAFCNDINGFAIYAIGYTDNIDGKNVLTNSTLGSAYDIATGTSTTGNSQWAMKLSTPTDPAPLYPITIQNSFSSYHTVPNDYMLVASRDSATDTGEGATGSTLTSTYQVYISTGQPAGTYAGQVKYVMVHPYNAPLPNAPVVTDSGYISYNPGDFGVVGTMGQQEAARDVDFDAFYEYCRENDGNFWGSYDDDGNPICIGYNNYGERIDVPLTYIDATSRVLIASNYRREGYGFVGWSDKVDWELNSNDANGNGTGSNAGYHIYGPNATIEFTAGQYDTPNPGLSLYAVWAPSAGSLQGWSCPNNTNMPIGTVTALTDQRDNQTYAVAKLADGRCWMVENLRLESNNSDNSAGVLSQGYGGLFAGLASPENAFPANPAFPNSLYSTDGSTSINIGTNDYPAGRMPRYNNINTSSDTSSPRKIDSIYGYGNYYTWAAAKANTNSFTNSTDSNAASTSLCPSGWRLPRGGLKVDEANNDFWRLVVVGINQGVLPSYYNTQQPGYYGDEGAVLGDKIRSYPNNFVYAGSFHDDVYDRGYSGEYWSATADVTYSSSSSSLSFSFGDPYSGNAGVSPGTGAPNRFYGFSVRCMTGT